MSDARRGDETEETAKEMKTQTETRGNDDGEERGGVVVKKGKFR